MPVPSLADPHPADAAGAGQTYDLQALRSLMRGGSKTFFAASLLLPPRVPVLPRALGLPLVQALPAQAEQRPRPLLERASPVWGLRLP